MKIPLTIVEEFISKEADRIKKMDSKSLPEVLAEIQGEEAQLMNVDDHRTITEVSPQSIEIVLECWSTDDDFEDWISDMIEAASQPVI